MNEGSNTISDMILLAYELLPYVTIIALILFLPTVLVVAIIGAFKKQKNFFWNFFHVNDKILIGVCVVGATMMLEVFTGVSRSSFESDFLLGSFEVTIPYTIFISTFISAFYVLFMRFLNAHRSHCDKLRLVPSEYEYFSADRLKYDDIKKRLELEREKSYVNSIIDICTKSASSDFYPAILFIFFIVVAVVYPASAYNSWLHRAIIAIVPSVGMLFAYLVESRATTDYPFQNIDFFNTSSPEVSSLEEINRWYKYWEYEFKLYKKHLCASGVYYCVLALLIYFFILSSITPY